MKSFRSPLPRVRLSRAGQAPPDIFGPPALTPQGCAFCSATQRAVRLGVSDLRAGDTRWLPTDDHRKRGRLVCMGPEPPREWLVPLLAGSLRSRRRTDSLLWAVDQRVRPASAHGRPTGRAGRYGGLVARRVQGVGPYRRIPLAALCCGNQNGWPRLWSAGSRCARTSPGTSITMGGS